MFFLTHCSVQLSCGRSINLIKINRSFFVTSTEVSSLIWNDDVVIEEVEPLSRYSPKIAWPSLASGGPLVK